MSVTDVKIAKITLPKGSETSIVPIADPADILFDGKPFPWATMGETVIKINRRDVITLTLTMPVKLVEDTR